MRLLIVTSHYFQLEKLESTEIQETESRLADISTDIEQTDMKITEVSCFTHRETVTTMNGKHDTKKKYE